MIKFIIILVAAIILASILFTLLKKAVKLALFVGLVIIVFLVITSVVYPDTNMFQKGKDYILGKSQSALETGKDKATSYVIIETNETINKVKETIRDRLDLN